MLPKQRKRPAPPQSRPSRSHNNPHNSSSDRPQEWHADLGLIDDDGAVGADS